MKANYLFPHALKKLGWVLFLSALTLGVARLAFDFAPAIFDFTVYAEYSDNNLTDEIAATGIILGLVLLGFSKIKVEDEYSLQLRHDSLLWSMYIYYALLLITVWFIHGGDFFSVMIFSLFAPLFIFVFRFHYYLWRNEKLSES